MRVQVAGVEAMSKDKTELDSMVELVAEKRELEDEIWELRPMARLASVLARLEGENERLWKRAVKAEREREEFEQLSIKLRNQVEAFEEIRRRGW
jgi:hypothetical protein